VGTHEAEPDTAEDVARACLKTFLSDEAWQDIGFSKRPRVGLLLQKFRPAWKMELENRVAQTMLAALTATYVATGRINYNQLREIVLFYTGKADMARALGYPSTYEAARELFDHTVEYSKCPINDWSTVIAGHVAPAAIPDKKLSAQIFFGCVRFAEVMKLMVLHLGR
jgi:hypothetical protein